MNRYRFMRNAKQEGFTLIEVMVTIVIVSIGMLSLAGLLITGIKVNSNSESRMDAAGLAQGIMSRVSAAESAVPGTYNSGTATTYAEGILGDRFSGSASPSGVLYTPTVAMATAGGFTSIIVTLQWTNRGQSHQVELRSGVAN